jgi:RNA polymerase sigma-70 factor (ECF subfamily)
MATPDDRHHNGATEVSEPCLPLVVLGEAELVERAKADPDAFALLYERHVRSVYAFALSRVHDVHSAEDVTSQTFLKALRGLPRYEYRGAPFRSWLLRIAANLVVDLRRAPHAEVPLLRHPAGTDLDEEIQVVDEQAEQDIAAWEQAEAFSRLIAELTSEQRTAVQLRFVDGLQIAGIAEKMSRSEGSVKMLLMRALQNLRRTLALEACDAG